ncbi:MAG: 3-deoxy-7-phosphoheptulonate synthase [SAR324 cluster bacterium]|nr:3-deoxy-7-phosphoheptulonate synthase [SAR324 cluster bacterium]
MRPTSDLHVTGTEPIITPTHLKASVLMSETANSTVITSREIVENILDGKDRRLLAVIGPCSIHDVDAAMDYAKRLKKLADHIQDRIFVVMRVYFEKPRTTVGWKGLINDPDLNETYNIDKGLRLARKLLIDLNEMCLPTGTEMLDPITPQYIADLISWSAIGARTTESQKHREMASGLSMPVGFKNGTDGGLAVAVNAMKSAREPHHFLGIDEQSRVAIIKTSGNPYGHIVLRGGSQGDNYHRDAIKITESELSKAGLRTTIMVDCSHANSNKDPFKQETVLKDITSQIVAGNQSIIGFMIESNLYAGNQEISPAMKYGVSVTDKCLDWENTERILIETWKQIQR